MPTLDINARTVAKAIAESVPGAKQSEISDSRARGLRLRTGAKGALWQYRYEQGGKGFRFDLGSVHDWSLVEARELAADAAAYRRAGGNVDDAWMQTMLVKQGRKAAPAPEPTKSWDWITARRDYLVDVQRTKKQKTYIDYRSRLTNTPELARFEGRAVATITRREAAKAVSDIHARGVEAHAEHLAANISAFFTWLGDDARADETGVEPGRMIGLKAPARTKLPEVRKSKYCPPMHEVGRLMAIARSGAIDERIALAIQHLVFTLQRVTHVVHARRDAMQSAATPSEGLWAMTAYHRKTADKRDDTTDHVVPLPAPAWSVIQRAMELTEQMDHVRVFPGYKPRRAGDFVDALSESSIQHTMLFMPGIIASPHDLRRAFSKHGQSKFLWGIEGTKSILDHNEGLKSDDVTVRHYLHSGEHAKWEIMRKWCTFVEEVTAEALAYDDRLHDIDWLKDFIAKERYNRKHPIAKRIKVELRRPS